MSANAFLKNSILRLRQLHFGVSRSRIAIFAVTLIVFGVALGGLDPGRSDRPPAYTSVVALELPAQLLAKPAPAGAGTGDAGDRPAWEQVEVQPGQSLERIFRARGLSLTTLHEVLALNEETRALKDIRPGEVFEFQRAPDGSLQRMRYTLDEDRFLIIDHDGGGPRATIQERHITSALSEAGGVIDTSLFLAGKAAGLSDAMVMKLANIFGWDIDFVLDIRAGDRFYMLYEKLYRDGDFLRDGEILAATFVNQGERFQAIRFEAGRNAQYYAPDGRHMRKAFLRAPLNFSYISSGFNPRRFHPILKRVKAHNGIDYRAPRGTPVYAAGDGRVIRSAYSDYNGHHVFIQHANHIVTKYLHFTKRTVAAGDRVQQGQTIGTVGSTGLAQAPHLHYEFVVNGTHRNPRTVSLPAVEPLDGQQFEAFRQYASPYLMQLSRLESASLYAARE